MEANGGGLLAVPGFHLAQKVHEKVALYLGVVAPWGDQTNFPDDSAFRCVGTLSQLRTININPAIAIGPWEGFSLGFGFNAQNAPGRFNQQFALPTRPILPWNGAPLPRPFTPLARTGAASVWQREAGSHVSLPSGLPGYAVVMADYQGTGTTGPSSNRMGELTGKNVLDAALAAHRFLGKDLSPGGASLGEPALLVNGDLDAIVPLEVSCGSRADGWLVVPE